MIYRTASLLMTFSDLWRSFWLLEICSRPMSRNATRIIYKTRM